jgi:hypothetical protein
MLLGRFLAPFAELGDLLFGQVLDADEGVFAVPGADQFVELGLDGGAVTVLRVLDEEDHQEGDDGRSRIDDELPGVGEAEDWPAHGPDDDDGAARKESDGHSRRMGDGVGGSRKCPVETHLRAAFGYY